MTTFYQYVTQFLGLPSGFEFIGALTAAVLFSVVVALILRFFIGAIAQIFYH